MTKIKLCGLMTERDIEIANRLMPDYVGFVFAPSKRQISVNQARSMQAMLNPRIKAVGVFVDAPLETVEALLAEGVIDIAQLHGREDEIYVAELKSRVDKPVIKAVALDSNLENVGAIATTADYVLLDSGAGGTGKRFDWDNARGVMPLYFLAGGVSCENIDEALALHPFGIDVSSGIETDGVKDAQKMEAIVTAVREFDLIDAPVDETKAGRFGVHGGQYVPETLMNALVELEEAYEFYRKDAQFRLDLTTLLNEYANRPSRLYFAEKMTADLGGAKIYLKREDLNHTGSHKINNVLGQVLMAKRMGKTRIIAETGAGQHGVATATAAALLGLECEIFMGKEDVERQALNVYRMRLLGATVHEVTAGTATLKDAVSETMREWTRRIDDTHYAIGSVMGPHPFPMIVRDFQAVISSEIKEQLFEIEGVLPTAVVACVGGGSNAIGTFHHFINEPSVALIGCEAAGRGITTAETAATISTGSLGIFHGMKSYFCQDHHGQIAPVYSISAGLDYPGIGPEHAHLYDIGRAEYVAITDDEAVDAFKYLARMEGIIPAIESAHAVAHVLNIAPQMDSSDILVVCLSGRGDKDCAAIARREGEAVYE